MIRRAMPRFPLTIWRHLAWDLWRLVLLTATVLVTVIAFAAAIKPLADGKLGPVETLKFMLLAMPPMLQYALPFAACFGATLAYHRWAADNEITACHAGGISHRALLVPAIVSGIILAGTLLALSNFVIPRFLRNMAELVSQDASKLIVNTIKRGESIRLGDRMVYADQVVEQGADPASGAFQRLWLGGVLIVKLDRQGNVEEQASAREASIWLRRVSGATDAPDGARQSMTEVVIRPRDAVFERKGVRGEFQESIKPILIPNSFGDDPKFLSFPQLRRLRSAPETIDAVDQRRARLALAVARAFTVDALQDSLRQTGRATLIDPLGQRAVLHASNATPALVETAPDGGRRLVLRAMGERPQRERGAGMRYQRDPNTLEAWPEPGRTGAPGSIVVEQTLSDGRIRRQSAGGVLIRMAQPVTAGAALTGSAAPAEIAETGVPITLQLLNVSAQELDDAGELLLPDDAAGAASGAMSEWVLSDLRLADTSAQRLLAMSSGELVAAATERMKQRPIERGSLGPPVGDLLNRVSDLMREVLSKVHERLAMSVACLVMILTGTVMAMRLRDSLPLTIYLWAFFPALATVISISAGQQLTHGNGPVGLLLLWGGVAALAVYAGREFLRLARH